jgi:hypothetical protein
MDRRWLHLAVGFGALCRVRQYAAATSLWHDESFVALNVLHIPFRQLTGPVDWAEPSPPGFLAAEKLMAALFGPSEYALRALPLLAGIAGLVAFAHLARRVCRSDAAAGWALLLLAASPKLIADASQVKHFTLDLLLAVVLAGLALRAYRSVAPRAPLLAWGAVAAVGLWFSYATAFTFAGTGLVLAAPAVGRWPRASRRAFLVAALLVLASAVALLGPIQAQRSDLVVHYWVQAYPDLGGAWPFARWLGRALVALFDYFWQPLGGVLLPLALLAAGSAWRAGRRPLLALLWLPVLVALAAAAVRWWPFGGNAHMVFAAPAVLLLAGDGIEIARRRLAARRRGVAACALALLFAPGLADALYHLAVPRYRHELRPVIAFMQEQRAPGDQLAVFDPATFEFYTGRDLRGAALAFDPGARVWVITPRGSDGALHPDVQRIVDGLRRERPAVTAFEAPGAAAYLFGAVALSPP